MKNNLIESFLEFSKAANFRSTVDIKDGLKPVHRRLLYTLSGEKAGFQGSLNVVGKTLGLYHPSGDASIYAAAVRLAQPFKTRYPLISFEGNIGTVLEPNSWAHGRYTSMQLSDLGREALVDIKKDAVEMQENFDGTRLEPEYLPGRVPVALMNGTLGIGVGMSSSIPPHNLRELAMAIEHRIDNPTSTVEQLMRYIKGPDFPTGGTVTNPEALLEAYKTGSGSIRVKADYDIVTEKGKTQIIIKEAPYLVDPVTRIIAPLREMFEDGYEYIEDYENRTGKGKPFELAITLTKNAPVFEVIKTLIKETAIESTILVNLTTHVGDGKFQKMGLVALIDNYIQHNLVTNARIAMHEKKVAEQRKLIVEGLIKAHAEIDEVVEIVKSSKNTEAANKALCVKLDVVPEQARAILAMRLSQLTKLDIDKLVQEKENLIATIRRLDEFLNSKELQLEKVKKIIKELSKKYGDARRTIIREEADVSEVQDVSVFLTDENEIFVQPTDVLPENRRNTKGKRGENLISVLETKSDATIWVAAADGIMYPVAVASLTISDDVIKNTADNFGVNAKAVMLIKPERKDNIITITEEGIIKRSALSDYNVEGSFRLCKLREDDSLSKVFLLNDDERIIMLLHNKKYVAFEVEEVRKTGTNTIGTKLSQYKVRDVDAESDYVIFADAEGNGKKILSKDIQTSGRRTNGLACNDSVHLATAKEGQSVYIFGETEQMIRIPMRSISRNASATTRGVALYNGIIGKILTK